MMSGDLRGNCTADVFVTNAGELHDLRWDGPAGVDHGVEPVDDLGPAHNRCGHLDDGVAARIPPRRLDVDDDHVVLETEDRVFGALCQRLVRGDHIGVGAGNDESAEG